MRYVSFLVVLFMVALASGCGQRPQPATPPPIPSLMSISRLFTNSVSVVNVGVKPPPPPQNGIVPPGPLDDEFDALVKQLDQVTVEEAIEILRNQPKLIRYHHSWKGTLLFNAIRRGRSPLVQYLLDQGVDPNARTRHGFHPLQYCFEALRFKQLAVDGTGRVCVDEVFDLLLKAGADPRSTSDLFHFHISTENDVIKPTDTILEVGEKYQRCHHNHCMERNAVLARLRDALGLPVDAMLPINANSLYLQDSSETNPEKTGATP